MVNKVEIRTQLSMISGYKNASWPRFGIGPICTCVFGHSVSGNEIKYGSEICSGEISLNHIIKGRLYVFQEAT